MCKRITCLFLVLLCSVAAFAADYLYFTAVKSGSHVGLLTEGEISSVIEYSKDGESNWGKLPPDSLITLNVGDTIFVRSYSRSSTFSRDTLNYVHFDIEGEVIAGGNISSLTMDRSGMSVKYWDYCFYSLFANCTGLVEAPDLPSISNVFVLPKCMYASMFSGCTNLRNAPVLGGELGPFCYASMFKNCTSLKKTPQLPTNTLEVGCYAEMFSGCTSLDSMPRLLVEYDYWKPTLKDSCFYSMFAGCKNLKGSISMIVDSLPKYSCTGMFKGCENLESADLSKVNIAQEGCCKEMFSGCSKLVVSTDLSAVTRLGDSCFYAMFAGCKGMERAPELPKIPLAKYCYSHMFENCTGLAKMPDLLSDSLAEGCYESMFAGCTGLTECVWLPVSKIAENCYAHMFENCSNLSRIEAHFTEWGAQTTNWVSDVASSGTFVCHKALDAEFGESRIPQGWNVVRLNMLKLTANEAGSAVGVSSWRRSAKNSDKFKLWYSVNGTGLWTLMERDSLVTLANEGDFLYVKSYNPEDNDSIQFKMEGSIAASGSVMSLIDGIGNTTDMGTYKFERLFSECVALTEAPELPAVRLSPSCFASMFLGCSNLVQAPELPATELTPSCYAEMFGGCGLVQAPELPATKLASFCYGKMFMYCERMLEAPDLPATVMADSCYYQMFRHCISMAKMNAFPVTETAPYCCYEMFNECWDLDWSPKLLAKDLAEYCYYSMFVCCYKIQSAELCAETFGYRSCNLMFTGCTGLKKLKAYFSEWPKDLCWTGGVAPVGVLVCSEGLSEIYGDFYIPYGWRMVHDENEVPNYLTFTANEANSKVGIKISKDDDQYRYALEYSVDAGQTWSPLTPGNPVTLSSVGDKVLVRGNIVDTTSSLSRIEKLQFTMSGSIAASGSVTSLIDGIGRSKTVSLESCFAGLFENCVSLTQSPEVPGLSKHRDSQFQDGIYDDMFKGCSNLSKITVGFTEWPSCSQWVKGVASTGTFICPKDLNINFSYSRVPVGWSIQREGESTAVDFLTFVADEPGSTFSLVENLLDMIFQPAPDRTSLDGIGTLRAGSAETGYTWPDVQYSLDGGASWMTLNVGDTFVLENVGDSALIKGINLNGFSESSEHYYSFSMTGSISAKGSVMSLIDGKGETTVIPNEYCFYGLFKDCVSLTHAPRLTATTLKPHCYSNIFAGCSNLSSIEVSFTEWDDFCDDWVSGVAANGSFIAPKELPQSYGTDGVPSGWTIYDTNATNLIPEDNAAIWTSDRSIYVRGTETLVEVYDLSGRLVKYGRFNVEGDQVVTVPAHGSYLVKIGKYSRLVNL